MKLLEVYDTLLKKFGKQDWWPTKFGLSPSEWEVCVGAILTQNTNWNNVELALSNMKDEKIHKVVDVLTTEHSKLELAIKPSGFYRQKATRLKTLANHISRQGGFRKFSRSATRKELLKLSGLGPETADSILLYALNKPNFVIDAYTKRVFTRLGFNVIDNKGKFGKPAIVNKNEEYELWKWLFESTLPKDVELYKEFHALIVELAKHHCKKRPECNGCPMDSQCPKVLSL